MNDDAKSRHESEYKELEALFIALLYSLNTDDEEQVREALYELSALRADHAFRYVLDGLNVDYEQAIILLQNLDDDNLTDADKETAARLQAAIDNLIDFTICEEYQLYNETIKQIGDDDIDFNSDEYLELLTLCGKYNDTYALVENADISYAGFMAYKWMRMSANDWVVYWTQNDAKVRPWHMELQGYTAQRDEFPSWMIPPIEYNCRCYLEYIEAGLMGSRTDLKRISASSSKIAKPSQLSNVYEESLAKCGRIFSPAHPYFSIKEADKNVLRSFVSRLKEKYYGAV